MTSPFESKDITPVTPRYSFVFEIFSMTFALESFPAPSDFAAAAIALIIMFAAS